MSLRARVTIALVATALALGVTGWFGVLRLQYWDETGLAGLTFFPEMPKGKQPPLEMFRAGRVFMVYPTSAAERAGIRGGDFLVSINGIPQKDNEALNAKAA